MKSDVLANQVRMYWRMVNQLRHAVTSDDVAECLDEIDTIAHLTDSSVLRAQCQRTIARHQPLHLVSDPA